MPIFWIPQDDDHDRPKFELWLEAEHPSAETIAAYIDGRLSIGEQYRVIAHLGRCERCEEHVANVIATLKQIRRTEWKA